MKISVLDPPMVWQAKSLEEHLEDLVEDERSDCCDGDDSAPASADP